MARFAELDDAEVDRLLQGDTPVGHEDLAPVAELAAAMRASATSQVPAMGPALRSQIRQRPHVPPRYAGMTRRRLQLAAAAAALVVVSIAASQNALPAAAQRLVSNAADVVSIDVPHPDDDGDELSPTHVTVTTPPSSTKPAAGNDAPATPATPGGSGGGAVPADPGGGEGNNGDGGLPEKTPGGAIPADPGTPGDDEPTTPATPRPPSGGSGGSGGNGQGTVGGRDTAPGGQRDT